MKNEILNKYLNEGLEIYKDKVLMKKISEISKYIDWDIDKAVQVAYELLTDVNAHKMASKLKKEWETGNY